MRVLVHADDLGMSVSVNDTIFAAFADGLIDSASLLVTGPAAGDALARRPGGLDLGVHLDLTEFPALTGAPGLTELRAAVLGSPEGARAALERFVRAHPAVVRAEWAAQIAAAVASGVSPSHLDSHHHVHALPAFWPVVREVLAASGIRGLRGVAGWRPGVVLPRRAAQRARALRFRAAFRGFVVPDAFASASVAQEQLAAGRLRADTLEVMVHPGNPHSPRYAEELAWLRSGPWPVGTRRIDWATLVAERGAAPDVSRPTTSAAPRS